MRDRLLLLLSLALNVALVLMVVRLKGDFEIPAREISTTGSARDGGIISTGETRTNVVLRRQHFEWRFIESDDYAEYIANLRRIGCPEKTIRDIIVADVTELYAGRLQKEVVLPEQQWWTADPDMNVLQAAADQIRALEVEKEQLLTQLLGPGWNPSGAAPATTVRLDGPVLNGLAAETRRLVDAQLLRIRAAEQEGDAEALALAQTEARRALGTVLTPEQMEEFLLRYSANAKAMREQLRGFGANAEEFRRIFRARDGFDQQIELLTGDDAATRKRRRDLEAMRDAAVRETVGPDRYALYQLTQDPLFQNAQSQAENNGAEPEKVLPIFEINQASQAEIQRITNDPNLSEEERASALQTVERQQQASIRRVLGNEAPVPPLP